MKLFSSRFFPLIFIPISFVFTLVYSWSTSPLFLGDGIDSSIFKTIGFGLSQGKIPYIDLFDHKGGLFFLIESAGWFLAPGRWGLFIVQVIFMAVTLTILFKTARLVLDSPKSFGATMSALLLYVIFMESGNQCETYMLPFTGMTLYLALYYFTHSSSVSHPLYYSLVYGLCFAIVFWIRPNDAVSQIGSIMAGIFIFLLTRKMYINAILNAVLFLAGCAIITLPVVGFYAYHDCLYELMEGTFLYNMRYVSDNGMPSAQMILVPSFVFGFLIWMSFKNRQQALSFIFIPMLLLTLFLIGKRDYGHYLIIIVIPALLVFTYLIQKRWNIALAIILTAIAILSFRHHRYIFKSIEAHPQLEAFYTQTQRIISNIPENERDQVWNLNLLRASNDDGPNIFSTLDAFINSGITPCNRVFVYFHLSTFPESETVHANKPKWILADPTGNGYEQYEIFLKENYIVTDSTDGTCVGDVILYKLNDEYR